MKLLATALLVLSSTAAWSLPTCWKLEKPARKYQKICIHDVEFPPSKRPNEILLRGTRDGAAFIETVRLSERRPTVDPKWASQEAVLFFEKFGRRYCDTEMIEVMVTLQVHSESGWMREIRPSMRKTVAPDPCHGDLETFYVDYKKVAPPSDRP